MKTTFWVPIPGRAVPVQLAYEASDNVDLLERTIIRLLSLKAANATEIARTLGFSDLGTSSTESAQARRAGEEMIDSAIRELVDKAIVVPMEEGPDRYRTVTSLEQISSDLHEGWAVYVPHIHSLLPTVIEGRRLPESSNIEDAVVRNGESPRVATPLPAELSHMLLLLSSRIPECWVASRKLSNESAEVRTFELGPRVRSIFLDRMGRSSRPVTCWARVELLPMQSGAAEIVFFEPQIHPTMAPFDGVPFSPRLRRWVEMQDLLLWKQLEDLSQRTAEHFSAVLRMLRLDPETVDREVAAHRSSQTATLSLPSSLVIKGDSSLEEELTMAHKWLVLSRRDPTLVTQVRDSYSRMVERLCGILAEIGESAILQWESRNSILTASRSKAEALQREFEKTLDSKLRQTSCHALSRPFRKRMSSAFIGLFSQSDLPGAGKNIGRWLLPLALLGNEDVKAYAAPIASTLRTELLVLGTLDDLVRFRNAIAHDDVAKIPPALSDSNRLDSAVMKVMGILAMSYLKPQDSRVVIT